MAKGGGGSGPTVAKAYVAIIPTTKDAQKNISKALIPELDSAGKEGGEKLSGGIGASLKSGASRLAGLAKAAIAGAGIAAVTKFVHDSVGAFSQFEQLSGGVQKIFNEIDTSTIISDAQNAYKELGISANEYLESMTSVGATFAATLGDAKGYDVAKEGLKAISDFASGTGRSVDLLTEKYTLITRATSSYQSIADQFSGILPATSEEFLRQAQEAGLLGDSYQKLTDVPLPEYQEALTNMLTRGVDSMGLLGNSAAEAYTTLEGSTNMMKSAWQNLLVAFGSGDQTQLESALHGMAESVSAWAKNLLPRIGTIFSSIVASLPILASDIIAGLPNFVSSIADALVGILSKSDLGRRILEVFRGIFGDIDVGSVIAGIGDGVSRVADTIGAVMSAASAAASEFMASIDPAFVASVFNSVQMVGQSVIDILGTIGTIIADVVVGLLVPTLSDIWTMLTENIMPGLQGIFEAMQPGFALALDMLGQVYNWISQLVGAIVDFLQPTISAIFAFIGPLIGGLLEGIQSILSAVISVVTEIWEGHIKPFVDALVERFGGFFSTIGKWISDHQAEINFVLSVIGASVGALVKWIGDTIGAMVSAIGSIIGGIVDIVTNIFDVIYGVLTGDIDLVKSALDGLVSSIGDIFWGVVDLILAPFRSAFNSIRRLWNSTVGSLSFSVPDWVPGIGGKSFGMPKLASGGILTRGGTVMVGEAGPEILSLPSGARVAPLDAASATSGETTYSVVVGDVDITDDDQVRRVTREYLEFLASIARPGAVAI